MAATAPERTDAGKELSTAVAEPVSVSDCACNYAMLRCVQHRIMVGGCFVDVMLCDANHCPGAVCILFTFENGRRIFHTGDFRWSRSLLQSSPTYRALVSFSAV